MPPVLGPRERGFADALNICHTEPIRQAARRADMSVRRTVSTSTSRTCVSICSYCDFDRQATGFASIRAVPRSVVAEIADAAVGARSTASSSAAALPA